jgi:GTPase
MFVDEIVIRVKGGNGGDGCTSFRREKYVPNGGPDGGNGGKGSNIIFKVDEGLRTLLDFRYNKIIKGQKGDNGSGKSKQGKNAEDIIVKVPPGTIVKDFDTDLIIADLTTKDQECIIAYGGRGGKGNRAFANAINNAPNISEYGEPGEEKDIKLELKLLADVGLIGMPSVGKSTILSKISASKPKIAAYHFTTLSPNLGVVKTKDNRSYIVADLPGLIKGASLGEGLGDQFLKHIERTRIIVHVIDMSGFEGRDPYDDYNIINKELEAFSKTLIKKPQIIIANKMDIESAKKHLLDFKTKVNNPIYEISALNNIGLEEVLIKIADMLDNINEEPLFEEEKFESYVLYKFQKERPFTVDKQANEWVVRGNQVERLLKMTKFKSDEAVIRFAQKLRRMGIDDKLREMGAKTGDKVRILDFEFEYRD